MYIIAHRCGYKESNSHENSLEALKYIINSNYIDGVEFDIHLTKDNKLVVAHDSKIKINNKKIKINKLTYKKLDNIYLKLYNIHINTIDEMLSIIPSNKKVFIEIKMLLGKNNVFKLIKELNKSINKYNKNKITIISFILKYLNYFHLVNRNMSLCLLINRKSCLYQLKSFYKLYINNQINIVSLDKNMITYNKVKTILESNKDLGIYTIDSIEEYDKIINIIGNKLLQKYSNRIYITTSIPKLIDKRRKI